MNNLQSAKKTLLPKKKFLVTFEETETYSVEVIATDLQEASEKANDMWQEGEVNSNGDSSAQEINIKEIKECQGCGKELNPKNTQTGLSRYGHGEICHECCTKEAFKEDFISKKNYKQG